MTGTQRQKLQAVFGALLLVTVGPVSGLSAGGAIMAQAGNAGNQSLGAGNQPIGGAGNQPTTGGVGTQPGTGGAGTQSSLAGAGNQPAGGGLSQVTWNDSTEPSANQTDALGPRPDSSRPYAVVGNQPTDPNNNSLYEDVNGDGQINIVDSDALQRNLNSTAVGANWSAYDYTGDNRTDVGDALWLFSTTRRVAINDTDGDGLPDAYERNWTGTEPTVADTDGDGLIDGSEDPDGDGLINYREYRVGSDPHAADTDGDGLSDWREINIPGISPTKSDTDGDGIPDPADDLDGDNLSVENESVYNTSRQLPDTDDDGLQDGSEVYRYGTDPTVTDTDGDGIDDGAEIRAGMDPLVADSDGDGVADTNETLSVTRQDNETDVALTLRAEGTVANATIDSKPSYFPNSTAHAGPTVRIENRTRFENATIAMPINDSVAPEAYENLSIYTWNGSAGDNWSRVETTIENGTAKADVEHFSYFTVLNTDLWVELTTRGVGEPIDFAGRDSFQCRDACNLTASDTVVLGGEPSNRKITIEQGRDTYEVVPLSNGQTIEEFYNQGNGIINSPLPVTKSDTSRLFFWSGPDGLSMTVVQDKPDDGSGGVATFEFDGLPTDDGEWVVQDDPASSYRDTYGTTPDWLWTAKNTDGGAFRGGLTNSTITLNPRFNETATRSRSGKITDWEVLSGRATEPSNESLTLDQNITIRVPGALDDNESDARRGSNGTADFTYDISENPGQFSVVYQTEQTEIDPAARVTITGSSGTTVSEPLSIGTVGTVQERVDLSALDAGPADVSLSADGVDLRARLVESADTDGDGISDNIEAQTWLFPSGSAGRFNLSATDPDTDGDGLTDSEEVSFTRTTIDGQLRARVASARSNPERADSDGDGLTDLQEVNGVTVTVVDSHSDAVALRNLSADEDPDPYVTEYSVSTNPLVADTDGDGLSDGEEAEKGTDPTVDDTDTDGTDDNEELDEGYDPTLFDITPPTITVTEFDYDTQTNPFASLNYYYVDASVRDQSGTASSTIIIDGEPYPNTVNPRYIHRQIDVGTLGLFEEALTVTKGKIRATDEHGNSRTVLAAARSNGLVEAVKQGGALDTLPPGSAGTLGTATGISSGTGQVVGTVDNVVNRPTQTLSRYSDLEKYSNLIENSEEIPQLLVDQYRRQQRTANPYYRDGEITDQSRYSEFRIGYYSGLLLFEAAASAAGGSAGAKIKKIDQVQTYANKAKATRAARYYRAAHRKAVSAPASRVSSRVTQSVAKRVDADSAVVTRTMAGAQTVGASVRTARYIADTPNRVLRDLNDRGQRRLRAYYRGLRRSGSDDTGLRVLTDGGQDTLKGTLENKDIPQAGQTAAELQRRLDTDEFREVYDADLPDDTRNSLLRAQGDGDLSASETARAAKALDGEDNKGLRQTIRELGDAEQRRAYKLVGETGDDGVELIGGMKTKNQETFFNLGTSNRFDNFDDFDTWRTAVANAEDVNAAEASRYVARVDRAADRDNIEDVGEILDDTTPRTDSVAGESGEAASAVRYADKSDEIEVEMEPGNQNYYDMSVTGNGRSEYVEMKTKAEGTVDERYISEKIGDMNRKYNKGSDDDGLDVEENSKVLEIRTRSDSDELSSIRSDAERALRLKGQEGGVHVDEIRLVADNGDIVTVEP